MGGPLKLADQAAFRLFWILVAGCALVVGLEQLQYLGSYPGAWFLSIVLLAATAIPAGVIIYRLDDFEPEPVSLIAIALLWGGVVAVTFSGIVNLQLFGFLQHVVPARTAESWAAALTAPVNEELYKGLGLVVIYLMARREIDNVMDGLVYGAMIGLGFQVVENVQYFMGSAAEQGGAAGAVVGMFFLRVVVSGLYSHMLFTGFVGVRVRLLCHPEGQEAEQAPRRVGRVRDACLGGAFRLELPVADVSHGQRYRAVRRRLGNQGAALSLTYRDSGCVCQAPGENRVRPSYAFGGGW
jgi:RsiW-degrading membrane proteinase PrsW (M82 family)